MHGMDRGELEELDRETLVVRAQAAGIRRARILTRPELIDELLRLDPNADESQLRKSRGFFGRARDLVARVVERGLHLPDAADRIRTIALGPEAAPAVPRVEPQAMPTVTLAEIYAAQGHRARAVETLRRVLEREPEHAAARALLARLEDEAYVAPAPPLPPEPEVEPELFAADSESEDEAVAEAEAVALAEGEHEEERESDQEAATTQPGPTVAGPGYAGVDVHAKTDVFEIVPEEALPPSRTEDAEEKEPEEVDDCFAIPLPRDEMGGRMYTRWNVSWSTIGALLGARPSGRFVVRAHVVTPGWDGPTTEVRDLIVDPDDAEAVLQALPEPSVVRVAVGWLDGATFVPLAHSPALEMARDRLMMWTPRGAVPVPLEGPAAAPLARALDGSRRAAHANG
jgi:hypothetical protein